MKPLHVKKGAWKLPPRQTLIGAGATLLVLILCAWLPSMFRADPSEWDEPSPAPTTAPAAPDRRALWADYRTGEVTGTSLSASEVGNDAKEAQLMAQRLMDELVMDAESRRQTSTGEMYIEVAGGLRLYHVWREWTGDWGNWLEFYIDIDTREVYYFYVSSECYANFSYYANELPASFNTEDGAEVWGELTGLGAPSAFEWSGDPDEAAQVRYRGAAYTIRVKCYFDVSYPAGLFDFKAELTF